MAEAKVGDDVFGEDPTVNALEKKIARKFGFEAGLFVPSGTMANQLSINALTDQGEEVLIEETGHIVNYESTAAAHLSSVQLKTLPGQRGKLSAELLTDTVRGSRDWEPQTSVIALENTTNKGGGCCYSKEELSAIRTFADNNSLAVHLDGARIWNAMTAKDIRAQFFGTVGDTMSVCFSKGLGAPVGSMVLSSKQQIAEMRRMRKMWGGGMRQIGILAAAADYAVENNYPLLQEDHRRARELTKVIDQCYDLSIERELVETNILIFDVLNMSAHTAVEKLEEQGVRLVPFGPNTLRATFHFHITDEDLQQAKQIFRSLFD